MLRLFVRACLIHGCGIIPLRISVLCAICAASLVGPASMATAFEKTVEPVSVPDAQASTELGMKPYYEIIEQTEVEFEMVPIRGGTFFMGSKVTEDGRNEDEGPRHQVEIAPFWMGRHEMTWDAYEVWGDELDILRRSLLKIAGTPRDEIADAITRPTEAYTDMSFGMGMGEHPAICMTQHAARTYCKWLSAKTGRYYRLPTEAEWEYACRAGTQTAYSYGDDAAQLDEFAWYLDNSDEAYHEVGLKKPNPWGLHDMHGNVAEWVLDQHVSAYSQLNGEEAGEVAKNPLAIPTKLFPRVIRGGSWEDEPSQLRSAARAGSSEEWKEEDPQIPQSIWYFTDALGVGFRVVRPLVEPTDQEKDIKWNKTEPEQVDADE